MNEETSATFEISGKLRIEDGDMILIRHRFGTSSEQLKQVAISFRMFFAALGHKKSSAFFLDHELKLEVISEQDMNTLGWYRKEEETVK